MKRSLPLSSLILSRISWCLILVFSVWGVWFYWAIIGEINDEIDDALEDYSETLIVCSLSGEKLPTASDASNNQFYLRTLPDDYVPLEKRITYKDSMVYIPQKREEEPARILTTIFEDANGNYKELTVLTPTFEREDLRKAILFWIVVLYLFMLLAVLFINIWVLNRSLRPLHVLLRWLNEYHIGGKNKPLINQTRVIEFRKLNEAAIRHTQRNERLYEEQKEFIGNASHEMQTPLAICQNRLEMMMEEDDSLSEEQLMELAKVHATIERMIRQNRSLLLLSKIDNGQFNEVSSQNLNELLKKYMPDYEEVYMYKQITLEVEEKGELCVEMDDSLAATMLANLLKNAYTHSPDGGIIRISIDASSLEICNTADGSPLDARHVFNRFWHSSKKEGSTGLGLSIVYSICRLYGLEISYKYCGGNHCFRLSLAQTPEE